jgi:hypothetical protein
MPRTLPPRLEQMLRRANPNVATFVELSARDQAKLLRRQDQFLAGPTLVSMTPAASAVASPSGALTLAATDALLIDQYTDNGIYNIPQEDGGPTLLHTVAWRLDPAFGGCVLSSVTVLLKWAGLFNNNPDVRLQIYRASQVAGVLQRREGTSIVESKLTKISFAPLLAEPVMVRFLDLLAAGAIIPSGGGGFADVTFDLTPYRLEITPLSSPPPGPDQTGELPELYFSITTIGHNAGTPVEWRYDTTSAQNIASVGFVREKTWTRSNPDDPASVWAPNENGRAMTFKLKVQQYAATSQEVYAVTLPTLPSADSTGRIVFEASEPRGTSAALELSTAGTGGPWTAVKSGDIVTPAQLAYHLRLTMNASPDQRRAPAISAIGIDFRNRIEASVESTVDPMTQEVAIPFLTPSIGEGSITLVRTGRRDYRDLASDLATSGPDTQIECDIYLGSRHPQVGREDWFHTTRALVSTRQPSATNERLSLLSIAKKLKRNVPARIESINVAHTVVSGPSPTTQQVRVSPALAGASTSGNEYDGRAYYIRVRKSAVPQLAPGSIFVISGNTGVDKLDFTANADPALSKELPAAFAVGDEIEVHSGQYLQPALTWVNQDPADIWWELQTVHRGIPTDRIGRSDVGTTSRSGLPPKVTDRAPGDAVTQAKCKVTLTLRKEETADKLIDQLSFIMGGSTVEIAGQIVFRQIYPLRDAAGRITVAPDPATVTFDPRDYFGLETPTGREQRISEMACDYGVDTTAAAALPTSTAVFVDADAIAALELQDVEGLGTDVVPAEISRWCFNSADGGFFLATQLASQVVLATSTGVRLWPWNAIEPHPELTVGDTVIVVTDQYTDWDPATNAAIRGMNAYPLTIVSASVDGKRFRGFLQGLAGVASVKLKGGDGDLQDFNPAPAGTGPSLEVAIKHFATTATITHSEAGGTLSMYIDGVGPVAVPASPFTGIARPASGSRPIEYTIRNTATSGEYVSESVTVLPVGADADTVTPVLTVVQSNPTATTVDFLGSAVNPSTGAGITPLTVELIGCSCGALGGPGVYSVSGGVTLTIIRPAFNITTQASIRYTVAVAGGGTATYQRTILNQVKDSFGPSLELTPTVFPTYVSIAYTAVGTVEYSIDGGAYAAAPASPFNSIARDTVDHTYAFRVTLDGQTVPGSVAIPAVPSGPGHGLFDPTMPSQALYSDATNEIDFSWTWLGSAVWFQVYVKEDPFGWGYAGDTTIGATGFRYASIHDLDVGGLNAATVQFYVRAVDVTGVLGESDISSGIYNHT